AVSRRWPAARHADPRAPGSPDSAGLQAARPADPKAPLPGSPEWVGKQIPGNCRPGLSRSAPASTARNDAFFSKQQFSFRSACQLRISRIFSQVIYSAAAKTRATTISQKNSKIKISADTTARPVAKLLIN